MHARLLLLALLAVAVGCAGPRSAPAETAPHATRWLDAIEAGDTEAAVAAVQSLFEAADAEFTSAFGYDLAPYDQPLNSYSTLTDRVTLGRMPTAAQTPAYWRIYSERLTGGSWDPDAFFADADEARTMAAFNQAYLAAHEAGHDLAYGHAVNPEWERVGDGEYRTNVHCQELFADRLAAAFLGEVIRADARGDTLRQRYRDLMASIDARIPEAQRVRLSGLDQCSAVPVEAVQDEATFQRYVSAYFARQRLLLAAPPPLAATLDTYVRRRRAAFVAQAPDLAGTSVTTLPTPPISPPMNWRGNFGGEMAAFERDIVLMPPVDPTDTIERTSRAYALRADGGVHVVETQSAASLDRGRLKMAASYDALEARTRLQFDGVDVDLPGLRPETMAGVQSAVELGDGDVLVLLVLLDVRTPDMDESLGLARLRRQPDGSWRAEQGPAFPRTEGASDGGEGVEDVLAGPDGAFVESDGRLHAVDLARLAPVGEGRPIDPAYGDVMAMDGRGHLFSAHHSVIGDMFPNDGNMATRPGGAIVVRSGPGGAVTLAGSGLTGDQDAALGRRARFGTVYAMRAVDGAVLVIEAEPFSFDEDASPRLRRISLP